MQCQACPRLNSLPSERSGEGDTNVTVHVVKHKAICEEATNRKRRLCIKWEGLEAHHTGPANTRRAHVKAAAHPGVWKSGKRKQMECTRPCQQTQEEGRQAHGEWTESRSGKRPDLGHRIQRTRGQPQRKKRLHNRDLARVERNLFHQMLKEDYHREELWLCGTLKPSTHSGWTESQKLGRVRKKESF